MCANVPCKDHTHMSESESAPSEQISHREVELLIPHCGGSVGQFRPCTLSCDTPTIITKYLLRIHLLSSIYLLLLYNLLNCTVPACECYECHLIFLQIILTYDLPCQKMVEIKVKCHMRLNYWPNHTWLDIDCLAWNWLDHLAQKPYQWWCNNNSK